MRATTIRFPGLRKLIALLTLAVALAGILSLGANSEQAPDVTYDGLQLDPTAKIAILYLKPGTDFSVYEKFKMLDAYVAFKKNWERDTRVAGRRIPNREMERIRDEAGELLQDSFRKELEESGGYEFVEETGDNIMILRPALIDLEVAAPDISSAGRVEQYVTTAAVATLYIEMYDSVTGEILARAIDRRTTQHYGMARWANRTTNRADAQRLFTRWASLLRAAMDEVRAEHGLAPMKKQ